MTKGDDIDSLSKDDEERMLRKRAAARVRQQRCRARKKAAVLEQRLPQAKGKEADEIKKELEHIHQFATPAKLSSRKKYEEPSPYGMMPYHMPPPPGYPPFMMAYPPHPMHPMMMHPQQHHHPGLRSPRQAMIDPTIMGSPAKAIPADPILLAKIFEGENIEPAQHDFSEDSI